jgi:hypothetical protein
MSFLYEEFLGLVQRESRSLNLLKLNIFAFCRLSPGGKLYEETHFIEIWRLRLFSKS